jgi:hypothetical protein
MELQVHLGERLLHVLDVGGCIVEQALTLAQIGTQLGNLALGPEAGAQQAMGMEPLQPLRIADVRLVACLRYRRL